MVFASMLVAGNEALGETWEVVHYPYDEVNLTVIGEPRQHQVKPKETLLDIAREYGLGYNEINRVYPHTDPWLPPPEKYVMVPTCWVLPPSRHHQLVINLPELRIYYFSPGSGTVQTYPIGIGDQGWESPLGECRIAAKRKNPTWYIPKSLWDKYETHTIPPGPENPLGDYFMALSIRGYGIHGTNMPWGVGRLVSHGCIRCYPEHIEVLYPQVAIQTILEIIYEPVKIGVAGDQIFVEAHPDVYGRLEDYEGYALEKLAAHPLADRVDYPRFELAIRMQTGVPTNVTHRAQEEAHGLLEVPGPNGGPIQQGGS